MKKYRIANRFRFIVFMTLVLTAVFFLFSGFTNRAEAENSYDNSFRIVEVKSGESLWQIAKLYCPENEDIRMCIYEIKSINGLAGSEIYAGQTLTVPVCMQ